MMCSMVCGSPHTHASEDANVHFFMDALQRPSPTRRRFRVFQTAQGWSWPVVRHSSGVTPLSAHRVVWLPRLFHWLYHSAILAAGGVVSSSAVASRKLLLDLSRFWGAECLWSECRLSLACFVRSALAVTALRMSGGAMPERA